MYANLRASIQAGPNTLEGNGSCKIDPEAAYENPSISIMDSSLILVLVNMTSEMTRKTRQLVQLHLRISWINYVLFLAFLLFISYVWWICLRRLFSKYRRVLWWHTPYLCAKFQPYSYQCVLPSWLVHNNIVCFSLRHSNISTKLHLFFS